MSALWIDTFPVTISAGHAHAYATTPIAAQCTNDFLWNHTEIKVEDDLLAPGAKPGTIPSDVDQATGLERLELIGKMQGVDIFDMRPLDASRKGM